MIFNLIRALVITLFLVIHLAPSSHATGTGKAVIVSINDVYRLTGINSGRQGGMARVRALRAELERSAPDLLFLHGGDFLSPSFLGRTYKGAQMIDLMNVMDGKPATGSHDPRMFVAFGNHEFDDSHCSKKGPLAQHVTASEFTWLASNLDFSKCDLLAPIAGNKNIAASTVIESGGLKIGLYGLTLPRKKYSKIVSDPEVVSCEMVEKLRAEGADVVVALTHLSFGQDLRLLGITSAGEPLATAGRTCLHSPDLIIGGHDHRAMALPNKAPRLFKADADAISAWVIEISRDAASGLKIDARLEVLDESRAPDPLTQRLADQWLVRHDERYCALDCIKKTGDELKQCKAQIHNGACLKEPIARSASLIETEEEVNRSLETGFGNWVADRVRAAGQADIAFINAGAIRLNFNIAEGTVITRRHLEQMFPFKNKLVVREVPGAVIWAALEHTLRKRGEGAWAHFSGLAVRLNHENSQKLDEVLVRRADGKVFELSAQSKDPVKLASLSFVMANGDGHGFALCPSGMGMWDCKGHLEKDPRWPATASGEDLSAFVRSGLKAADKGEGVSFATNQRLCSAGKKDCLIDRWDR